MLISDGQIIKKILSKSYDIEEEKTWRGVKECPVAFGVCLVKKSLLDKTEEIADLSDL